MHGQHFYRALWRSLKYEEVYLRDYRMVPEARAGIDRYLQFYNYERRTSTRVEVCGPRRSIRKKSVVVIGGSAPKPPEFSAFRPELAVFGSTIIEALERRIGLRRNA